MNPPHQFFPFLISLLVQANFFARKKKYKEATDF
jgi:hypothetical protein